MPIDFPSYQEIIDRTRSDIAKLLPDLDPTIFGSFVRAFADSQSGRAFDIVLLQQQLLKQLFPQTADGEFLERWAAYEAITRNAATVSNGSIVITGTPSTLVPLGTSFTSATGNQYQTLADVTLISQSPISVSSLTRSGQIVTATTASSHSYASNISVTIAGAVESDYNGTHQITVISATEFTYTITATPTTPATGTITSTYDGAPATVQSVLAGADQNLSSGAKLTIVTPIAGVDPSAYVQFTGLTNGLDIESDEDLLVRVLQSRANPVANFNIAAVEKAARSVAGVTRVKVKPITPEIGDVTILFVRDNDVGTIIPDGGEISDVFDAVYAITPVNTAASSVIVSAPTPVAVDFNFTELNPNTTTMRAAVVANLEAFFRDSVDFEDDITSDKYRSAIIDTIDPDTGDELQSFTLLTPSGDIEINDGELGILGTVILT